MEVVRLTTNRCFRKGGTLGFKTKVNLTQIRKFSFFRSEGSLELALLYSNYSHFGCISLFPKFLNFFSVAKPWALFTIQSSNFVEKYKTA